MQIVKHPFGRTPSGHSVTRFTLHNDRGIRVSIIDLGAAVQSIVVPDREGTLDDIVLGYGDAAAYWHDTHYMGAVVGRYANRIAQGRFTLDGIAYALSRNQGAHHLHGGAAGFDKRLWRAEPALGSDRASLTLQRVSVDGEEGYPGNLAVSVHYSLNNDNELRIQYRALTDRATPVNLTHHSYFNLSGNHRAAIDSHMVWINADYYMPVDAGFIPTGEITPVAGTPLDFRWLTLIQERIDDRHVQLDRVGGYDHSWVLNAYDGELKRQAAVYHKDSGRLLEVYTSEPGLQFYSGNSLYGRVLGKSRRPYRPRQGLCLETQHFPNSPNQPQFPSTILRPGETYRSETVYRFLLKSDYHQPP
jgi:aldose 1-epimerase